MLKKILILFSLIFSINSFSGTVGKVNFIDGFFKLEVEANAYASTSYLELFKKRRTKNGKYLPDSIANLYTGDKTGKRLINQLKKGLKWIKLSKKHNVPLKWRYVAREQRKKNRYYSIQAYSSVKGKVKQSYLNLVVSSWAGDVYFNLKVNQVEKLIKLLKKIEKEHKREVKVKKLQDILFV